MATVTRTDFEGAVHHVYGRGNNKQDIFCDDEDRRFFLNWLEIIKHEEDVKIYAYCLMTNHYHLLLESGAKSLSRIMIRLLTAYAQRFHRLRGSVGHVFQGRYGAKICPRDGQFLNLLKYINLNPVAAGIVSEPSEWPWSGHRDLAVGTHGIVDQEFPLSFFDLDRSKARRGYQEFMSDLILPDVGLKIDRETPKKGIPIVEIVEAVAAGLNLSKEDILSGSRRHELSVAKIELVRRAKEAGYNQADVARLLGCSNSALTHLIRAREKTQQLKAARC
jgi:putative transposase